MSMEHLALEIFDLATEQDPNPTGSRYATLPEDATITITDTSEVFASGDVWSHSFTLNVAANAHIFGSAADMHGARLHDQLDRRRARLWVDSEPMFLGYLRLDSEAEVDEDGDVDVTFESGQKTFSEMIEGISAREVSVGDVVIGVALNRKRVVDFDNYVSFTLDGLKAYANKDPRLNGIDGCIFTEFTPGTASDGTTTPYAQRWPKLVKSHGTVLDSSGSEQVIDYTNVQTPYDAGHPFCNLNICYPFKSVGEDGEEVAGRGYTLRQAHGRPTTDGGDNQTRFNNSPNFYLLYFIDRLFKDMRIHIEENQAKDVEDLKRVFLLNYGCFYEEIENDSDYFYSTDHTTPADRQDKPFMSRYGQYYIPFVDGDGETRMLKSWSDGCKSICVDSDIPGKVLLRNVRVEKDGESGTLLEVGSIEGKAVGSQRNPFGEGYLGFSAVLQKNGIETDTGAYSAYLAYATGENYPDVEINEVIEAMKSMFGIRLLFSNDYSTVRIVLLRSLFRGKTVQEIECDVVGESKQENSVRGFRMTYGKGKEDTSFYYKGFNDMFSRAATIWKDTSDKHDYSQWQLDAVYNEIKQYVSAMNRICYVTPVTGDAYIIKVDEDEDVLFPSLFEAAGFMDAEDGDCSQMVNEAETVEEIQAGASPVIMNEVGDTYASLFSGDMKAPTPDDYTEGNATRIATFGRATLESIAGYHQRAKGPDGKYFTVYGDLDYYISEGFSIRMKDNYAISNGGTPFDEADPGLQFGIMRSSGPDAYVRYYDDPDDDENDAWEVEPGSGAVSHPDTCDGYGNQWAYGVQTGRTIEAVYLREAGWNVSGADDRRVSYTWDYVLHTAGDGDVSFCLTPIRYIPEGARPSAVDPYDGRLVLTQAELTAYVNNLWSLYGWQLGLHDTERLILSAGTDSAGTVYSDGRFSLKLRAEKPNPYFDATRPENDTDNRRYLEIEDPYLRGRGLMDQFYKEYSYWVRNARIAKRTVRMELAQLLSIDKTKRVRVGDVTGFIRKMQYSVSSKTGLGTVEMEIMYI